MPWRCRGVWKPSTLSVLPAGWCRTNPGRATCPWTRPLCGSLRTRPRIVIQPNRVDTIAPDDGDDYGRWISVYHVALANPSLLDGGNCYHHWLTGAGEEGVIYYDLEWIHSRAFRGVGYVDVELMARREVLNECYY